MVPQPPSKGALVKVYRANPVKEGLVCSVGGDQGLSFIYVGAQTVSGDVGDEDKRVIAQYAKSVLGETRFINAMGVPAGEGEYPDLSIRVHAYKVNTKKAGERITRDGKFQASFSIKQAGMLECATSDPVLVEKHYEAPSYSAEKLPSIARIQEQMVKEAVRQVVRQFVPTTSTELRPIKGGSELAENAGKMIDGGNCSGAYEGIKAVAQSPQTNDANLLYNAGVALECMAWNAANDQKTQVDYLKKARAMYQRAAFLKPGDADMQKAAKEVTYEVETFFASFERQKKTRDTLKQYQGPKSY
jgi:hypothetical protein